jgi:drug/metabolite transporter (DMT)-like permease
LLRFLTIDTVDVAVSAALINLHPFIAAGLAILILGEAVTTPLSALFLRDIERIGTRLVAGTLLIVLGVCLITAL